MRRRFSLVNGDQLVKLLVENDIGVRRTGHDFIELKETTGDQATD